MQQKCKLLIEALFSNYSLREKDNTLLLNKQSLTDSDIESLSHLQGMYQSIEIKRSGTGLVIILTF